MALVLTSNAFTHQGSIPARFTCDGEDASPPLAWTGVPTGTQSLVLIVDDPDAPDPAAPKKTWVHWVIYDLPPHVSELSESQPVAEHPREGGTHGMTDFRRLGYGGPCPPIGEHRYFFKLFALGTRLGFPPGKNKSSILRAMDGHVLAEAVLMGTYARD